MIWCAKIVQFLEKKAVMCQLQKLKGKLRSKKKLSQMKEHEKCNKNEPSPTSMRQMVLEIFHFKVRNLGKIDIAIL